MFKITTQIDANTLETELGRSIRRSIENYSFDSHEGATSSMARLQKDIGSIFIAGLKIVRSK